VAKVDRPINFRTSKDLEVAISKVVLHLDRDKSSVLRTCVRIGIPMLLAHPELVDSLGDGEADVSNILDLLECVSVK